MIRSGSTASSRTRQEVTANAWRRLEHASVTLGLATSFSIFLNVALAIYLRNVDLFIYVDGSVRIGE